MFSSLIYAGCALMLTAPFVLEDAQAQTNQLANTHSLYNSNGISVAAQSVSESLLVNVSSPDNIYVSFEVDEDQNGIITPYVDTKYSILSDGRLCTVFLVTARSNTVCGGFSSQATVENFLHSQGHWQYSIKIPVDELDRGTGKLHFLLTFWDDLHKSRWSYPSEQFSTDLSLELSGSETLDIGRSIPDENTREPGSETISSSKVSTWTTVLRAVANGAATAQGKTAPLPPVETQQTVGIGGQDTDTPVYADDIGSSPGTDVNQNTSNGSSSKSPAIRPVCVDMTHFVHVTIEHQHDFCADSQSAMIQNTYGQELACRYVYYQTDLNYPSANGYHSGADNSVSPGRHLLDGYIRTCGGRIQHKLITWACISSQDYVNARCTWQQSEAISRQYENR